MCLNIFCVNNDLTMSRRTRIVRVAVLGALTIAPSMAAADATGTDGPVVVANNNADRAGVTADRTVTVRLRAAKGRWQPEGPGRPTLTIDAFGEEGKPLMVPGPLVRVREGTTLAFSIRNSLDASLRVHGLCTRDGGACSPLDIGSGETRSVRFVAGRAGTYHYWATSMGARMPFRELAGALIVDPPDRIAEADRIFVITEWNSFTTDQLREVMTADEPSARFLALQPAFTFVINGLSWPATERLTYRRGEVVHWRVINLSSQSHPMHLHGFYFRVMRAGDGLRDDPVDEGRGRSVVTHVLPPGGTLSLEWTPEREGNWLFHCHIMAHISLDRRLDVGIPAAERHPTHGDAHLAPSDQSLGMAGMVMGITVLPSATHRPPSTPSPSARQVIMAIRHAAGGSPAIGIALNDGPTADPGAPVISPGPPLVLTRGEPIEIAVINRLDESTSIHWHGLEIDSYYDGVHGWSGIPTRTAPIIEPGGRFVARFTPPRAGTFIYHTHLHDYRQLSSGLYGALIVTEPGHAFDPTIDHVVVLGRRQASVASSVLADADSLVVNGERTPRWTWRSGSRHRVRLVNITPDDILAVSLRKGDAPVVWRPLLKDGVATAAAADQGNPATVTIAVGETYDFEVDLPPGRGTLWLDVRSTNGKWQAQGQVLMK